MKYIIISVILSIGLFWCIPPYKVVYVHAEATTSDLIAQYSTKYNVPTSTMVHIVNCESGGNTKAIGDNGTSFGLVQIHITAHKDITRQQAENPEFAIKYLAKNLSQKRGKMWTCFRQI